MILISAFLVFVIGVTILKQHNLDIDQRRKFIDSGLDAYTLTLQIIDFTFLTVSITLLLYLLNKQENFIDDKLAFKREKRTLIVILVLFDLTYVLLAIFDFGHNWLSGSDSLGQMIFLLFSGLFFDFIPICLILFLHSRNNLR